MSTGREPSLEARLLGEFTLLIDGCAAAVPRAGKTRRLLQCLLARRGQVVSCSQLQDVLWPETGLDARSSSLRVVVHSLRRHLTGSRLAGAVEVRHQDGGYVLEAPGLVLDSESFEAAAREGSAAESRGDTAFSVAAYERALAHYRGDFLPGESGLWAEEPRQWLRSIALRALDRLAQEGIRRGTDAAVVHWCRRIVAIDPYRESAYQALMISHGRRGELGSVLAWYRICARRLEEDLGLSPAAETESLFHEAMRGDLRIQAPVPV
ncbi:Transcriptional regulatory protein MoaR1 [Streptomyces sp. RB5]|uniref:Transcriptional regulatory protein MoaR1 n=1 Tax=Streptomyces smaragdinus TaxID=2585196 RepID=A0A7K0CFG6_9ACTN|nr:BTAD domain-containing putative transcriptional regulator [Streptomyces smaragdinus]MQY12113.1 Transcriptional regulatory protein MoaR1 [Streptomyces smaragdinus]